MNGRLEKVERPGELPSEWDALAGDCFQKREFLSHCHEFNRCDQRYYLYTTNGNVEAGAVVYTLRLDLFTYMGIKSPMTMQIIGIPASVSSAGMVGNPALFGAFHRELLPLEHGLVACLNLDAAPAGSPMSVGRTWPDIVLKNRCATWDDYLSSLRSDYRRRLRAVLKDAETIEARRRPCAAFTDEMHSLYLEVFRRSEGKLERLEAPFFRNLPANFCLNTFYAGGRIRGWTITVRDGDRFSFFLGGQDYGWSPRTLYHVKLMDVVRTGIESGATTIDLGQSAEVPKMRLGGEPREKFMLAYHHRAIPRALLRAGMGILSYRKNFPQAHVFKEELP